MFMNKYNVESITFLPLKILANILNAEISKIILNAKG